MGSARRVKEPTATTVIMATLRAADDFMSQRMLRAACVGVTPNQISAALCHLRKRHAVGVVVEPDGVGWWFALPPAEDDRSRVVDLRAPELRPRRPRRFKEGTKK